MSSSDSSSSAPKNQPCSVLNNTSHSIKGLYGSSFSLWFYYRLQENPYQNHIILTANKTESQRILHEFSALFSNPKMEGSQIERSQTENELTKKKKHPKILPRPEIVYLPAFDNLAYYCEVPLPELVASRMNAFAKIKAKIKQKNTEKQNPILLISEVDSLMDKLALWDNPNSLNIQKGEEYSREKLLLNLSELGYQRMSIVESPKEFSIRGEILDVFPVQTTMPYRIVFFDDCIEEIKLFDTETQISQNNSQQNSSINSLAVFPASEVVASEVNLQKALDCLRQRRSQLSVASYQEALQHLEDGIFFSGVEKYRCYFSNSHFSWLELVDKDWKVFLWQRDKIDLTLQNHANEIQEDFQLENSKEPLPPNPEELYYKTDEVQKILLRFSPSEFYENLDSENIVFENSLSGQNWNFKPVESLNLFLITKKTLKSKIEDLKNLIEKGVKVIISASSLKRAEWIADILEEFSLHALIQNNLESYLKSGLFSDFFQPPFVQTKSKTKKSVENFLHILPYPFQKGFYYQNAANSYLLIYEDLLFGEKVNYQKARKISNLKTKISDLKLGDFVVHMDYGIGKYKGINRQKIAEVEEDFLLIEYKNEDKLFLPVDQITYKIQKFNTAEEVRPSLDALGSNRWQITKKKVEANVQKIAHELIEIYAKRQISKSRSFNPPEKELQFFANDFAFVETEDQLVAIEEVWSDLKKEQPMDRLICGDAGFGKTEVAMRAAFQVVMEGFQVLLIAPTTILVQQHFKTFQQRFKNIERSRYRSSA